MQTKSEELKSKESLDSARTAAAVLCVLQGKEARIVDALEGLASKQQLTVLAKQLQQGDRNQRAAALAVHLSRLVFDLDAWSLR